MTPGEDSSLTISERNWEILILTSSSAVFLLTFYCLLVGITTVFTHLYYFPIILLAYRYQKKGVIYSLVLSTSYLLIELLLQYSNTVEIFSALLRVLCFTGVAIVVAYLSTNLTRKQQDFFNLSQFNESIISNANVWLAVIDAKGNIITWNRAAEDISGYSGKEVTGKNSIWKQLYPDSNYRKKITGIITTITREKQFFTNFETVIITKDGRSKTISWNTRTIPHEQGVLDHFVAIGIDITERKQGEMALRESEERFRMLLQNANDGIFVFELSPKGPGKFLIVNDQMCRLSGYTPDELTHMTVTDIDVPEQFEKVPGIMKRLMENGYAVFETDLLTKDRKRIPVEVSTRVFDLQGKQTFLSMVRDITERKRAEDQLKESETFLNEVGEIALVGGWQLDIRTNDLLFTKETYRIHEVPEDTIINLSQAILFFDIPGRSTLEAALQRCTEEGEPFDLELPFTNAKEKKLWTRTIGRAVRIDGKVVKLEGTFQDITERKNAEEMLKKSRIYLAEAMDLAHLVNWEFDVASGIFTFNDRFYALYGTTAEREGGYQMTVEAYAREFVHPDESDLVASEVQKAINSPDPNYTTKIEHRIIRRDGEIRNIIVQFAITKDEQGRTIKTHGANQDITERKTAENELKLLYRELEERVKDRTSELQKTNEALKESSERVQLLLNSTAEAIYGVDMQGLCTLCNTAFLRILGYERKEQVIGRKMHDLIHHTHPDGTPCPISDCRIFNAFLLGKGTHADNDIFWRADGTSFPVEYWSFPMRRDDNIIGVVVTFIDITERKHLEEQNLKSLKEKEMLLKEIHHRVKNNMQVISSLLFMQERLVKDVKVREILRESQNRIRSLALVHEELYRSANLDEIDYSAYLHKIVRQLSESYNVDPTAIQTQIFSEKVFLDINKAVPCSLILNELMSNAIKHAFPSGRKGIITIDFKFESGTYTLIFSDDGIGLAENITFEWTESLGMQLIAGLVKQLNGTIVSDRKAGTKYTITFPE
ncbi:MAG: hypothetical protein CVV30_05960 [Methanomicrobiales archaeon HGW-Methanomicrobiales-1]|jgi:PAS domain S-box-containing protein|nr:MAG: hypothetical protein CVV30_05960 [Methanomicrobiales archaeon HGW-Methanomicrobiales-1]